MYPDPEELRPERWLKDGKFSTEDILDPLDYAFGFGRRYVVQALGSLGILVLTIVGMDRVCPGKAFAEVSMFIFCATILHTFNISPPLDENGKPRVLDVYMGSALAVS